MNNGRDCPHGRQGGKCDTCDLITVELELQKVTAERDALAAQLTEIRRVWDKCGGRPDTTTEKEELRVAIEGNGV